jgi:hypothetical protein
MVIRSVGSAGAVQNKSYTYGRVGKLITRNDADTTLAESELRHPRQARQVDPESNNLPDFLGPRLA